MTPAEEVRTAAEALRLQAKLATDGPWTCSPVWSPDSSNTSGVYSRAHPTGTVASEVVASGRVKRGYGGIRNPHNAVWITLMQPAVAEPLAVLLLRLSEDMRQREAVEGSASKAVHPVDFIGLSAPREDWTAALALARQINGGA